MLLNFNALKDDQIPALVNKVEAGTTFLKRLIAGAQNAQTVQALVRYLAKAGPTVVAEITSSQVLTNLTDPTRNVAGDVVPYLDVAVTTLADKAPENLKTLPKVNLVKFFTLVNVTTTTNEADLTKYFKNAFENPNVDYAAIGAFAIKYITNPHIAKAFGGSLPTVPASKALALSALLKAAIEKDIDPDPATTAGTNLVSIINKAEDWFKQNKQNANASLIGEFTLRAADQYLLVGAAELSKANATFNVHQLTYLTKVWAAMKNRYLTNDQATIENTYKGNVANNLKAAFNATITNKDAALELVFGKEDEAIKEVIGELGTLTDPAQVSNQLNNLFTILTNSSTKADAALLISQAKLYGGKFLLTDLVEMALDATSSQRFIDVLNNLANKQALFTTQGEILKNLLAKPRPTAPADAANTFNNVIAAIAAANPDVTALVNAIKTEIQKTVPLGIQTAYKRAEFIKAFESIVKMADSPLQK
jgi:hypothetical protein